MILSAHTARQLRNASLSALYRVAYDHDVDLSDVMASITPSQPIPQAPAARTYPPVPVAVQAEEVSQAASSADHSDIVQPISPITAAPAANPDKPTEPQAKRAAEGTLSSEPGGVQDRCESTPPTPSPGGGDPADEAGAPKPAAPTSSAAFSPAPKRTRTQGRQDELVRVHAEHRDWPADVIAEHMGVSAAYVRKTASRLDLVLPSMLDYRRAQRAATTEALKVSPAKPQEPVERAGPPTPRAEPKQPPASTSGRTSLKQRVADTYRDHPDWSSEQIAEHLGAKLGSVSHALHDARAAAGTAEVDVIPPATPQTPVAPPPTGEKRTLTERVRSLHQQHPTWTATMIAHELGAKQTSVSTILGQVRGKSAPPPEQPQFSGRRQMVEHYGEIAKRLGKS